MPLGAVARHGHVFTCEQIVLYFKYNEMMEEKAVIKALAALAQPVRLKAFRALVVAGPQGLLPGSMVETLGVPATTLSFHLKELMHAGLVSQERSGRNLIYRAEFSCVNLLLAYLTANCCQGADTCIAPPATCAC
jgi:DNA-binding transcriptional ArsR family regulator